MSSRSSPVQSEFAVPADVLETFTKLGYSGIRAWCAQILRGETSNIGDALETARKLIPAPAELYQFRVAFSQLAERPDTPTTIRDAATAVCTAINGDPTMEEAIHCHFRADTLDKIGHAVKSLDGALGVAERFLEEDRARLVVSPTSEDSSHDLPDFLTAFNEPLGQVLDLQDQMTKIEERAAHVRSPTVPTEDAGFMSRRRELVERYSEAYRELLVTVLRFSSADLYKAVRAKLVEEDEPIIKKLDSVLVECEKLVTCSRSAPNEQSKDLPNPNARHLLEHIIEDKLVPAVLPQRPQVLREVTDPSELREIYNVLRDMLRVELFTRLLHATE